jgi:ADP-ribosyl-[dinitrogen reductase] hydrolase
MTLKERILGGLWGALVGDALGVPVEFEGRQARKRDPVTGMRGYGTFNKPPGTWSDDSSLLLCSAEALVDGFDLKRMADIFMRWLHKGYWTPTGEVFDVGMATRDSIERLATGIDPELAGADDERSNGNGSLMRILPVVLRFAASSPEEMLEYAHRASCLTHRHPRSQMACGFYCLMVSALLRGTEPVSAYQFAVGQVVAQYQLPPYKAELVHFARLLSGGIVDVPEPEIRSSGYVVDTLEASLWCLLNSNSFTESILKAVNLGHDTDTTGCVTGGLAGVYYGAEKIPKEWLGAIVRKKEIGKLFERFTREI